MLQTMTVERLRELGEQIDELLILSHDPSLYLAQVIVDGCRWRVTDRDGANLVFRSQMAAKKEFEGLNVKQAFL